MLRLSLLTVVVFALAPGVIHAGESSGLTVVLSADKAVYRPGEPITFTLKAVNGTSGPIRLSFATAQRFDLVMRDREGREVWRWSAGRMFAQMIGEETLNPSGGELFFPAMAEGKFPPGEYTVNGVIPALEGALTASITVRVQ